MYDKKTFTVISPDLNKLQAVVIDARTTIFIERGSDPKSAKRLYEERRHAMNIKLK